MQTDHSGDEKDSVGTGQNGDKLRPGGPLRGDDSSDHRGDDQRIRRSRSRGKAGLPGDSCGDDHGQVDHDISQLVKAIAAKRNELPDDDKFRQKFPELFRFLTMDESTDEDKLEEPGGFTVFLDGSSWGWNLKVPALNSKCRGQVQSLFELFDALQEACSTGKGDWKVLDRHKEYRRRKGKKKY
jgi:hypothetical protein